VRSRARYHRDVRIAVLALACGCSFSHGVPNGNGSGDGGPPDTGTRGDAANADTRPRDASIDTPTDADPCPSGYVTIAGAPSRYKIFGYRAIGDQSEAWTAAAATCQGDGTHMAIIDDDAEGTALGAAIPVDPVSPYFWVGVTDAAQEGTWLTVLGGAATYLPWAIGQPNGGTSANCALMSGGLLYDWTCATPYAFACECD